MPASSAGAQALDFGTQTGELRLGRGRLLFGKMTGRGVCGCLLFGSVATLVYAGVVLLAVVLFVLGYEQPTLQDEYGEEYREYRRHVRGWIPQARPWEPGPQIQSRRLKTP